MVSDKETNSENSFFNPFEGLKKRLPAPARPAGKHDSDKTKSQVGGKQAKTGGARTAKAQPEESVAAQEAEDSAMFLSAMRSTPRYAKSYSSGEDVFNAVEPGMAELLAASGNAKGTQPGPAMMRETAPVPPVALKKTAPRNKAPREINVEDLPQLSGEDSGSFAKAMRGVRPVDGKGRDLPPAVRPVPQKGVAEPDYLTEFTQGKFEFALEYTEEFFEGHVMGLDPLVIAKIRAGQYSPEAHIDLHGLNAEQAYAALLEFVRHSYNQGRRSLVVVTGRGKNSPGGFAVLRQHMQDWLTKDPLKRVVLAFCTAQPKDGGAGALYVMLRKFKKNNGKIRWDKSV